MNEDQRPPISEEFLERFRNRPEFLGRLLTVFVEEEPRRVAALGSAAAAGDLLQTGFLAHALKGAAATMGMERLRDASRALELASKEGRAGDIGGLFAAVGLEIDAVFDAIRLWKARPEA